jgi:hypothetical protein
MDAEGAEMKILAGARETITRHRPNLLVELIAPYHDTLGEIEQIKSDFGYDAWIMIGAERIEARRALSEMRDRIATCNVIFMPK